VHSQPVAVKIAAEAPQFRRTGGLDVSNPLLELGATPFTHQDQESLCQSTRRAQLTTSPTQLGEDGTFSIVELRAATQQEPAQILGTRQYPSDRWRSIRLAPTLDETSDGPPTAAIAEVMELTVQIRGNLAAFLPATDQVREEPIESAWSLADRPAQLRGGAHLDKFANGRAIEMKLVSDGSNRQTLTTEDVDFGVTTLIPAPR